MSKPVHFDDPEYDENPFWDDAATARARPASEIFGAEAAAALVRRPGGRPPGSDKERIALRVDRAALAFFKADGRGWQTRINEALRKVAGLEA